MVNIICSTDAFFYFIQMYYTKKTFHFSISLTILLQLLQRLITDRRCSMDSMMLEGPRLVEVHPGEEGEQAKVKLSALKHKWEALQLGAEQRSATFTGNATLLFGKAYSVIQILLKMVFVLLLVGERVWS